MKAGNKKQSLITWTVFLEILLLDIFTAISFSVKSGLSIQDESPFYPAGHVEVAVAKRLISGCPVGQKLSITSGDA